MDLTTIFSLSSLLVMPFWVLMVFLPHWRVTKRIMQSFWVIVPPALLYAVLVLPQLGGILGAVSNPTLDGITALMGDPVAVTIAWVHFLAFDLFVGRWIYLDSRQVKISAWLIGPILYFTLMLGPVGFVSYVLVRGVVLSLRQRQIQTTPRPA
ncbi:MAG: ABA4-like family protein [Chloroflexota bacterium]